MEDYLYPKRTNPEGCYEKKMSRLKEPKKMVVPVRNMLFVSRPIERSRVKHIQSI